ncbi:MAG TPA: hypothetical protein VMQ10_05525 [Spirochaetia bacterium]|nr:hypothetical protein [Spirochaetia bacterium]
MKKRILASVVVLLLCISVAGAFAAEKKSSEVPWLASLNGPGTVNFTVTGGYTWWGLGLNAGAEFTLSQFALGPLPLDFGITAQGSLGFDPFGIGVAAAGLATLNIGFDFGKGVVFEAFVGLGPGIVTETWSGGGGLGFGIAEYSGFTWWFSKNIGLTGEEGYVSAFGWGYWYFAGIGVTFKL